MAKEYIEREALYRDIESSVVFSARNAPSAEMRGANKIMERIKCAPAADVIKVPEGWVCSTGFDDEHYLVHLTFPISEKQFKALGQGADLWETLRMDGE